ncbi:hypothetical protein BJAS_P3484 [Bathymodiolus japonicus methanotrophic gill symbiont]|uniref:hypothetical protein n=1 Tax=Bathymodiolus japonicus methanotrophic gill symbiont TaxID=113269 RepID=UPI001B6BF088|nr:hypothetical protein [Bathymodiolus japonicus methanotrophic gill symbiont]GFO72947.1 hypothetical protein BJAS_P3484 [Bathymodiolus japonicus methanotrophic gill symbiont]
MKESKLEKKVCDYAESKGWGNVKTYSKGYPDRVFYKDGKALFIEFKTKKGVVSEAQKHIMEKIM